jgi:hypothetical protein
MLETHSNGEHALCRSETEMFWTLRTSHARRCYWWLATDPMIVATRVWFWDEIRDLSQPGQIRCSCARRAHVKKLYIASSGSQPHDPQALLEARAIFHAAWVSTERSVIADHCHF